MERVRTRPGGPPGDAPLGDCQRSSVKSGTDGRRIVTTAAWATPALPSGVTLFGYPRPFGGGGPAVGGGKRSSRAAKPSPAAGIHGAKSR